VNKVIVGLLGLVVIGGVGFYVLSQRKVVAPTPVENPVSDNEISTKPSITPVSFNFQNPKKSAHFETNTPNHGAVLADVPVNIVIDFNFDLADPSEIKIEGPSKQADATKVEDFGEGPTLIDKNKLSLRRKMKMDSPDSIYKVAYKACWPDKSCHDGYFEFAIDRSKKSEYMDIRSKEEVVVDMKEIMFSPKDILISKGTRVVWTNSDSEIHYINTDPHPAHTYFLEQNSRALAKGDKYSVTFNTPGIYPYHCSAHEASMKGSLIVE
jgi:plastocyanin